MRHETHACVFCMTFLHVNDIYYFVNNGCILRSHLVFDSMGDSLIFNLWSLCVSIILHDICISGRMIDACVCLSWLHVLKWRSVSKLVFCAHLYEAMFHPLNLSIKMICSCACWVLNQGECWEIEFFMGLALSACMSCVFEMFLDTCREACGLHFRRSFGTVSCLVVLMCSDFFAVSLPDYMLTINSEHSVVISLQFLCQIICSR